MKGYYPDISSITVGDQKKPNPRDIAFIVHAVQELRETGESEYLSAISVMLDHWPYLLKRFGISHAERWNWDAQRKVRDAKSAVQGWKADKDESGLVDVQIFRMERFSPEVLGLTEEELATIMHDMAVKSAKKQLAELRRKEEGSFLSQLAEDMEDANLSFADIGTTKKEMRRFALRELKLYLEQIEDGESHLYPFGGIIGLLETKLITWKDVGMTEEEFNRRRMEDDPEVVVPHLKKIYELES